MLKAGDNLGQYRIVELLGRGGMGEVYAAEDKRLRRRIALKVLPPELSDGAGRRQRFQREARAAARLRHPGIVTIHSIEEAGDVAFITMELVEGETLRALMDRGVPSTERLLGLGAQLAEALGAAHDAGISHRDLKPGNVMVDRDGRIKVLDFGLAKASEPADEGTDVTVSKPLTDEGVVLGTVAYMSPEQAQGRPVDHRTDLFSLGVMLYELSSGQRPFKGDSKASALTSLLRDDPTPLGEINPGIPPALSRIVRRCLEKDPARRYQSARDLRDALEDVKDSLSEPGAAVVPRPPGPHPLRRLLWLLLGLGLAALGALYWKHLPAETEDSAIRVTRADRLTTEPTLEFFPSLSRDGRTLIYASNADGDWDLYRLRVGGTRAVNLTPDESAADTMPALSPAGDRIVFRSEREGGGLFMMGATGESVRRLTRFGFNPAWSPDGVRVVFATGAVEGSASRTTDSALWVVDAAGGREQQLFEGNAVQPRWSPDGHRIAYWGRPSGTESADIWTIPASGGEPLRVTGDPATDWNPVWSAAGGQLYFTSDRGGTLSIWRVPVDEASGEVLGPARPVTTSAGTTPSHLEVSADGQRLVHAVVRETYVIERVPFDPSTGRVTGEAVAVTSGGDEIVRDVSPDGAWVAYESHLPHHDISVARVDRTQSRALTDDAYKDSHPRFSPDGRLIAFQSNRSGISGLWTIRPDGSELTALTTPSAGSHYAHAWSPDGRRLVCARGDEPQAIILEPGDPPRSSLLPESDEAPDFLPCSWSSDGTSIAGFRYLDDGGRSGIVVLDLLSGAYRTVATEGILPRWLGDGRRLLYLVEHAPGVTPPGYRSLWLADTVSGSTHEVLGLSPPDALATFAVTSDDQSIVYSRWTREADIWMLTLQ